MKPLKWTKAKKTLGPKKMEMNVFQYRSDDGVFLIDQKKFGGKTHYLLSINGQPAPSAYRDHDLLEDAKWWAESLRGNTDDEGKLLPDSAPLREPGLRSATIRLAHAKPELRPHLLPLLEKTR